MANRHFIHLHEGVQPVVLDLGDVDRALDEIEDVHKRYRSLLLGVALYQLGLPWHTRRESGHVAAAESDRRGAERIAETQGAGKMTADVFNPTMAFVDCPHCESAQHVERVKGAQWICSCCAREFDGPALVSGNAGGVASGCGRRAGVGALVALLLAVEVSAQGLAVRYTMDPGSVPPAPTGEPARDAGVTVTKAFDGQPLCGSGSAYMTNWNGIVPWNDRQSFTGAEIPVQTNGRYFFRATFRLDADVDRVDGAKLLRVGYPDGVTFELFDRTTTLKAQAGESVYWGGVRVTRGCHRIEVAVAPTGVRACLDDVLVREWTGVSSGNVVNIMSNWSSNPGWEHDASNHAYFDDIEIYTDVAGADAAAMWAGRITGGTTPRGPRHP